MLCFRLITEYSKQESLFLLALCFISFFFLWGLIAADVNHIDLGSNSESFQLKRLFIQILTREKSSVVINPSLGQFAMMMPQSGGDGGLAVLDSKIMTQDQGQSW